MRNTWVSYGALIIGCGALILAWHAQMQINAVLRRAPSDVEAVCRASVLITTHAAHSAKNAEDNDTEFGSGVVFASTSGTSYILTAAHVIDGNRKIMIRLRDGRQFAARIVARDEVHDGAILAIPIGGVTTVALHTGGTLASGEEVVLVGYPIPDAFEDQHVMVMPSAYFGHIASVRGQWLEVDLAVIPGDSGAPLIDMQTGDVVAIADARFEDEHAIGIAVPLTSLRQILAQALASR